MPRLAESWQWENDGLALRLTLRSDVTFHDGTRLTASVAAEALNAPSRDRLIAPVPFSYRHHSCSRKSGTSNSFLNFAAVLRFFPKNLELPLSYRPGKRGNRSFSSGSDKIPRVVA